VAISDSAAYIQGYERYSLDKFVSQFPSGSAHYINYVVLDHNDVNLIETFDCPGLQDAKAEVDDVIELGLDLMINGHDF